MFLQSELGKPTYKTLSHSNTRIVGDVTVEKSKQPTDKIEFLLSNLVEAVNNLETTIKVEPYVDAKQKIEIPEIKIPTPNIHINPAKPVITVQTWPFVFVGCVGLLAIVIDLLFRLKVI